MRKLLFISILVGVMFTLPAQVPVAFKYQAVVRNLSGEIQADKSVSLRISLLSGGATGALVYSESHTDKTTNKFGLVDIEIGKGTPVTGSFTAINWSTGSFFIKVEIDPSGGSNYQDMGKMQLLSVPYALYAEDVKNKDDADADPSNELQKLTLSGTVLTLDKNGGSVTLPSGGTSGDNWGTDYVHTDATLTGQGTTTSPLKITDNGITSAKILDGTVANADLADHAVSSAKILEGTIVTADLADNSVNNSKIVDTAVSTNKLANNAVTAPKLASMGATSGQVLKWDGTSWKPAADEVSGGSGSNPIGPAGGDLTGTYPNPLIADNKVTSVKILDGTIGAADLADNAVTSAKITDGSIVTADLADQTVSTAKLGNLAVSAEKIAGMAITGEKLAIGAVTAEKLANSAVTSDKLAGNAVTTDKINAGAVTGAKIAQAGATNGQVLKWNGISWAPDTDVTGGGLILPYSGINSNEDFIFKIRNNGPGSGIRGETISGTALLGLTTDTGAANIGVAGQSGSNSGVGVWGNNTSTAGNGIAVKGTVQSSTGYSGFFQKGRFYIEGNTGIGTIDPTAKLEVNGQVKITGGSPGAGKVLTSDAGGLASWQFPGSELALPYTGSVSTTGDQAFSIWNTGTGNGIFSRASSGNGLVAQSNGGVKTSGVMGLAYGTGENYGVNGSSNSSSGIGVAGTATSLTGSTIGVYGMVTSPDGYSGHFEGGKFYVSGNAGIGVTAPSAKLDINGQVKVRGGSPGAGKVLTSDANGLATWVTPAGLTLPFSATVSSAFPLISITNSGSGNGLLAISQATTGTTGGVIGEAYSSVGSGVIGTAWSTSGTNYGVKGKTYSGSGFSGYFEGGKFYVSDNVGIGTNNPAARLDVSASQGPNIIIRDSDGGNGRPGIQFVNNYIHYISGDDSHDEIFGFYASYGDTRTHAAKLNIHGPASGNWGKFIGLTHDGNHGRISTDAGYLVLEPAGQRVGIGTDAPTQNLDVNGTLRVRGMTTGSLAGTVYRTSDGTLITGASDIRLKENIQPVTHSLEKIMQLNGVTFNWKNDPKKKRTIGFIAQEFEKIIPELVFTNENDGYKGINYAEVTAVLVEAVKELKAENERLRNENKSFAFELSQANDKYNSLNSRLEMIEIILNKQAKK